MSRKHMLIMLLCCLIPLALIGGVLLLNIAMDTALFAVLLLVCPLSHLLMMRFMGHGHGSPRTGKLDEVLEE